MQHDPFSREAITRLGLDLGKPVLVGFSAGPDSLCLLHLLRSSGYTVVAAHLDHSLRPASGDEAKKAGELCASLGIPFHLEKADVAGYAAKNGISIEEAGRELRYTFLFAQAARSNAQAVVTGHHAGDQVETVLMHFLRGSGLSGLAGIRPVLLPNPWSDVIPLVRPLLGVTREQIDHYCRQNHLNPVVDESNADPRYFRNRIRHELVPYLQTFNPEFTQHLVNMSEVVREEDDYLVCETRRAWEQVVIEQGETYLVLERDRFNSLPIALARRLMRAAIGALNRDLRDINFTTVDRALAFARSSNHANQEELQAGLDLLIHMRDQLVLVTHQNLPGALWPQYAPGTDVVLAVPGETRINAYWSISSSLCDREHPTLADPAIGLMDACILDAPLRLGTVKPGDRFQPLGMEAGTQKLGDFWTNNGLSARAREHWPLVRSGGEIVWVPGFRVAHSARVKPDTTQVLRLELIRKTKPEP